MTDRIPQHHYLDLVDGKFKETSRDDLKALFANWKASDKSKHMVIHFHGGLVSRGSAHKSGLELMEPYLSSRAYPVFFVWNTHLDTAIGRNLSEIGKEKSFKTLVGRIARFVLGKFAEAQLPGARGADDRLNLPAPLNPENLETLEAQLAVEEALLRPAGEKLAEFTPAQETQITDDLKADTRLQEASAEIANGMRRSADVAAEEATRSATKPVLASTETLMSPRIVEEMKAEAAAQNETRSIGTLITLARYGYGITKAVVKRYRAGRDHGLYTTVVEEVLRTLYIDNIGAVTWNMMKNDAAQAFETDNLCGGTAFVELLRDHWRDGDRITLVGHSTGAIYINHFLTAADKALPAGRKFDVIYLAAAAAFPFFSKQAQSWRNRVANFRSFGLSDEAERAYWEVPLVYKGSLLYLVSGLFEEDEIDMPLVGMQRYYKNPPYSSPDVVAGIELLGEKAHAWTGAAPVPDIGWRTNATRHGAFPEGDKDTMESLKHLIAKGF